MLRQYRKRLISAVLSCCLILLSFTACSSDSSADGGNSDTAAGLAYLQSLDNIDINAVDEALAWQHQHDLEAMHAELAAKLESGETSCWSYFEDYVMCGDSRFEPFSYYGFLPESNVWAESGTTIASLQNMVPDIVARAPVRLFLDYGMNDFCSGDWNDPEVWAQTYADTIRSLQEQLPNLKVYVCSIIPATDALTAEESLWTLIPDYNAALEAAFADMAGVCYIDCTELGTQHQDLYESDGKHFVSEFYELWGKKLILSMFDFEFDDGSGSSGTAGTTDTADAAADPAGTVDTAQDAETTQTDAADGSTTTETDQTTEETNPAV